MGGFWDQKETLSHRPVSPSFSVATQTCVEVGKYVFAEAAAPLLSVKAKVLQFNTF